MKRDEHYIEAERLLGGLCWLDDDHDFVASDSTATVLAALTHAVLATVADDVADPVPYS